MADTTVNQEDDKAFARNVTMFPDQWAVVDEVNAQMDFRNTSSALRHIVNEYRRMKSRKPYEKEYPAQADPA